MATQLKFGIHSILYDDLKPLIYKSKRIKHDKQLSLENYKAMNGNPRENNVDIIGFPQSFMQRWREYLSTYSLTNQNMIVNNGTGILNPLLLLAPTYQLEKFNSIRKLTNSNIKEFHCKICDKTFFGARLLNRHLKSHSNLRRYLCNYCLKGFNDTFDLKRHTRTHTGIRPYNCNQCPKAFTQRCSLESHLKKVHNITLPYGFKERREKLYICELCGFNTPNIEACCNHMKNLHPNSQLTTKLLNKSQKK